MVALSEAFGADVRLVAFMQYLRVIVVVITASLVARFFERRRAYCTGAGERANRLALRSRRSR